MKFFIDTANLDEIREAEAMGVLDGVTTNPSLVSRESRGFEEILAEICEVVDGPISAEVTGTDFDTIMGEARHLAKFHENIVVKIPIISEGLKAIKACSDEGIKVNVTLCFSSNQAWVGREKRPTAGADEGEEGIRSLAPTSRLPHSRRHNIYS